MQDHPASLKVALSAACPAGAALPHLELLLLISSCFCKHIYNLWEEVHVVLQEKAACTCRHRLHCGGAQLPALHTERGVTAAAEQGPTRLGPSEFMRHAYLAPASWSTPSATYYKTLPLRPRARL